nr:hypothetical protein [Tanacetum cinerariifolium]
MEGFRETLKSPIDYTLRTNPKTIRNTFFDVFEPPSEFGRGCVVFWERYNGGNSSSRDLEAFMIDSFALEKLLDLGVARYTRESYAKEVSTIGISLLSRKKYGRVMLGLIDNGPLVYSTVEEDGQTRPKKYSKLNDAQQIQDDCDVQEMNIILHGLPPDVTEKIRLNASTKQWHFCLLWHQGFHHQTLKSEHRLILEIKQPFKMVESSFNNFKEDKIRVMLGEAVFSAKRPRNVAWFKEKLMLAEAQEAGQILDEEQLVFLADPDCNDLSSTKAVLMENLLTCDPEVLSEVPYSYSYPNDMINQDLQEIQYSEQTHVDDFEDNDIHSVISLVEQMTDHVAHLDKENQINKIVNESSTAELERYKERITIFEQILNVDLNKMEKLIDSQMDDLIRDRNAKLVAFQQEIDTLKETLSNNVKEKESLSKILTVFKPESKEKKSKYIDKKIVSGKQNKELENTMCKMYRSTQAMHMLTKPQVFYDDTHKQALGYQNPFHLKKPQWIQPTLYDGIVIAKEHTVISVIDDEKALILEEESRSNVLDKQNDPISIENKIKISLNDYSKLNKIKEDFGKQKNIFEIQIKQLRIDNEQLLNEIMSQEIVHIVANSVDILDVKKSCVNDCSKCLEQIKQPFKMVESSFNNFKEDKIRVMLGEAVFSAKRPRNVAWFKEKLMLAEAQEAGQILDEEQLVFLADPDCNDLSSTKAVLMANLLTCDPEVLSEHREDPIECINKAMAFLSVVASRFPPSNTQIRTSSNPRNQATIQDASSSTNGDNLVRGGLSSNVTLSDSSTFV